MSLDPLHLGPKSTPALVSYAIIGIWTITVGAVFALIGLRIPVADVMVGILGAILSTSSGALTGVVAFWLAGAMTSPNRKDTKPDGG
jgi:hypothetical protein